MKGKDRRCSQAESSHGRFHTARASCTRRRNHQKLWSKQLVLSGLAGRSLGSNRPVEVPRVVVALATDRSPALGAYVVVLVAGREHQQQLLAHWCGPPAAGAEEARSLEFAERVRLGHHSHFTS